MRALSQGGLDIVNAREQLGSMRRVIVVMWMTMVSSSVMAAEA
jgi:hypothetical protein